MRLRRVGLSDLWLAAAAFLIPCAFSWGLLGDDLLVGPPAGFVLGVASLGLLPFPGYPLYLLAAKVLTALLPAASLIWRLNFISLFFGGLTSLLIYLTARRLRYTAAVSLTASLTLAFSPFFWRESLLASPNTFGFFLVCLLFYHTLGFFFLPSQRLSSRRLFAWGALAGFAGGLAPTLAVWVLPLWILGPIIVRGRAPQQRGLVFPAVVGSLLGFLLPYLYLPWRLLAPAAIVNTDMVPQFSELIQMHSLPLILNWLKWFVTDGPRQAAQIPVPLGANLLHFLRQYPFLVLGVIALGLFLNLRRLLYQKSKSLAPDKNRPGRLLAGGLPFIALGGALLLFPHSGIALLLTLSLGGVFWSLEALEYCYTKLGYPESAASRISSGRPTWFGWLVLVLIPLLAFLQSYPALRHHVPRAQAPASNLAMAREFFTRLPEGGVLLFPAFSLAYPFVYLQRVEKLRPDVLVQPFSNLWPGRGYGGRAGLEILGRSGRERLSRRWHYLRYWMQGLRTELTTGQTIYFLTRPLPVTQAMDVFLQNFEVAPTGRILNFRNRLNRWQSLTVMDVRVFPAEQEILPPSAETSPRAEFGQRLRLLAARPERATVPRAGFAILQLSLTWQGLAVLPGEKLQLVFWITPADTAREDLHEEKNLLWQTRRSLRRPGRPPRAGSRAVFTEEYQLALPQALHAGPYLVWLAVTPAAGRPLAAGYQAGRPFYLEPIITFWVEGRPYPGSTAVPRK